MDSPYIYDILMGQIPIWYNFRMTFGNLHKKPHLRILRIITEDNHQERMIF